MICVTKNDFGSTIWYSLPLNCGLLINLAIHQIHHLHSSSNIQKILLFLRTAYYQNADISNYLRVVSKGGGLRVA